MITPKLIFYGLVSLSLGGGLAFTTVKISSLKKSQTTKNNKKIDKTQKENIVPSYKYLIVNSDQVDRENNLENLFLDDLKQYKCLIEKNESEKIYDQDCQLFSLNKIKNNSDNIDINNFETNPNSQLIKTIPTNDKIYILKVSDFFYKSSETSSIKIVKNDDDTKSFATLTKNFEIKQENSEFIANSMLVKVKNKTNINNEKTPKTYKLKFNKSDSDSYDCKIHVFSGNLDNWQLASSQSENDVYLLISFEDKNIKKTEKELNKTNPVIFSIDTNNNEHEYLRTEYKNSYVGNINENDVQSSKLLKIQESTVNFLVSVASKETQNSPNSELLSSTNGIIKKNYKCKVNLDQKDIFDEDCLLIPLSEDENKSISFKQIKHKTTLIQNSSNFTENKFFKLIIRNSELINKNYSSEDLITIVATSENDENKNYGTVKVSAKYFDRQAIGTTKWFIVKSKNENGHNINNPFCKLKEESSPENCSVYKITKNTTDSFRDINLSTKIVLQASDYINKGDFLIVKFTNQQENNISSEIIINNNNSSTKNKYQIISPIFTLDTNDSLSSSNSVILK